MKMMGDQQINPIYLISLAGYSSIIINKCSPKQEYVLRELLLVYAPHCFYKQINEAMDVNQRWLLTPWTFVLAANADCDFRVLQNLEARPSRRGFS